MDKINIFNTKNETDKSWRILVIMKIKCYVQNATAYLLQKEHILEQMYSLLF
jgi:hypothetical protein